MMAFLNQEKDEFESANVADAGNKLSSLIKEEAMVGDVLSLDYDEADILVHDYLRQKVGGLPMGCFLLATRINPGAETDSETVDVKTEDAALILLRVIGRAVLSNQADTEKYRLEAAFRATNTSEQWDAEKKTDQFTLNQLRHAGVCCSVLGTFRMMQNQNEEKWNLSYGADISNFYSGQGMKVYKPTDAVLERIVNFTKPVGDIHPLAGQPVEIGRVRYCSSETVQNEAEQVTVKMDPTDLLARRTALFGMSRTGKSNTIKTIASAVFKLRKQDPEKGCVGQLIFDVNGEYCNDNPQDSGCLRNVWREIDANKGQHVATYGLFKHPYDEDRKLIKVNFFGEEPARWDDLDVVGPALAMLFAGKSIVDEHFSAETAQYVKSLLNTSIEPPSEDGWDQNQSAQTRYRRSVTVYRAILVNAGFSRPTGMEKAKIKGLFGKDLRDAMEKSEDNEKSSSYQSASTSFAKPEVSWGELYTALVALQEFMMGGFQGRGDPAYHAYETKRGKPWSDDTLKGLLGFLKGPAGATRLGGLRERHDPTVATDYSDEIVEDLHNGKLVIVDQSVGSPTENEYSSERIMKALFNHQRDKFINPERDESGRPVVDESGDIKPPPDVMVYVEEAHNLLPAKNADLKSIWARVAKEGSKFRIGLVYSTQEPSSILSNILKNTDNWFVAHLNNQDEMRELKKYYDFEMFSGQILKVPDTGFLRMRCLSNPYIVPLQVNKFVARSEALPNKASGK